jgi:hypothetical protein
MLVAAARGVATRHMLVAVAVAVAAAVAAATRHGECGAQAIAPWQRVIGAGSIGLSSANASVSRKAARWTRCSYAMCQLERERRELERE